LLILQEVGKKEPVWNLIPFIVDSFPLFLDLRLPYLSIFFSLCFPPLCVISPSRGPLPHIQLRNLWERCESLSGSGWSPVDKRLLHFELKMTLLATDSDNHVVRVL